MPTKIKDNPIMAVLYAYDPADAQSANARTATEYGLAADHHAAREQQARAAKNGQAAARHHATMLCYMIATRISDQQPINAAATLDSLVKHISTLHVQTRYARRNGKSEAEIADREAATRHYQALQSALRKASKGGEMPVISHYAAQAAAFADGSAVSFAPSEPAEGIGGPVIIYAPADCDGPMTQELDPETLLAYHTGRAAADPSPEGRDLHKTLSAAYSALLGHNASGKPHKSNARARLQAAQKKHGGLIANTADETLALSLEYLAGALAKAK